MRWFHRAGGLVHPSAGTSPVLPNQRGRPRLGHIAPTPGRGSCGGKPLGGDQALPPAARGDAVARPRLTELLDRGRRARLTLVSAPAGFGKTTLLARWLATPDGDQRSVAWLSLEEADSQPARFWTYLVTAIQRAVPEVGDSALALLQTGQPSLDSVLATLINELSTAPTELDLVLDDYHLVDNPDLQPSVAYLLEHLPPQVHLVISTRVDPALPLARLRARGELVEIRAADLRFTLTEVAAYLNDVAALELTTRRHRSTGDPHRRLDRRPAAGGALTAGACRRRRVHRCLRRRRPLHRGLPGRGGAQPPTAAGARLPAPDLHPRPVERTAVRGRHRQHRQPGHARAPGPRQPVPRPAGRHPPLVPLPPPVRRGPGAPTCSTAAARRSQTSTAAPAGGTTRRANPSPPCGTRSLPATSTGQPTSPSSPCPRCSGTGRRRPSPPGSTVIPDEVVQARPVLALGFIAALMSSGQFTGVEERLHDLEQHLPAPGPDGAAERAAARDGRRRPGRVGPAARQRSSCTGPRCRSSTATRPRPSPTPTWPSPAPPRTTT